MDRTSDGSSRGHGLNHGRWSSGDVSRGVDARHIGAIAAVNADEAGVGGVYAGAVAGAGGATDLTNRHDGTIKGEVVRFFSGAR